MIDSCVSWLLSFQTSTRPRNDHRTPLNYQDRQTELGRQINFFRVEICLWIITQLPWVLHLIDYVCCRRLGEPAPWRGVSRSKNN